MARITVALSALSAFLMLVAVATHAAVLRAAVPGEEAGWEEVAAVADNLTRQALIPVIAVAPLAAVAGGFALLIGGGGRQGGGATKLIGGAFGAVIVVVAARGLAA